MKVIGLTGGIGAGKSMVAKIWTHLGIPVFDADRVAKTAYQHAEIKEQVIDVLGEQAYDGEQLNRQWVSAVVFEDKALLSGLNDIIHPYVRRQFNEWKQHKQAPFVMREAAILFESGSDDDCDAVVLVAANLEERIQRVMRRDGVSRDQVLGRISNQWPQEKLLSLTSHVIWNDEGRAVIPQVLRLHQQLHD